MAQSSIPPTPDSSNVGGISPLSRPVHSPQNASTAPSSDAPPVKWPASPLQLPVASISGQDIRRPSIQFKPHTTMTGEPKVKRSTSRRRMSSPPPPPVFRPRVTFDTFEKVDKKDEAFLSEPPSFTLNQKHKDYEYNKRSRTFLCGLDSNDYSDYALEWLIDELVDDGDEVVCLRVLDPEIAKASLSGDRYREEAEEIMKQIEKKNHENKAISLVLEFSIGKVEKVIKRMIEFYEPAILIVGTRGKSLGGFQGLLPGSISKFCLQNSPVPVIVVRPNTQRARGKRKREQDPARHAYRDLLDKPGIGGHLLDLSNRNSIDQLGGKDVERPASYDEGAAVAAAVGARLNKSEGKGSPLVKVESAKTDVSESGTEQSPDAGARLMKSPELQNLESPELSGESAFGDDDLDGATSPESTSRAPNIEGSGNDEVEVAPVVIPVDVPKDEIALMEDATDKAPSHETEGLLGGDGKAETDAGSSVSEGTLGENVKSS